ncbi:APC family permease [Spiroplasma endosymbiont of Tiphia femorata]|uniref:APC family permease n=1 Tax=Spiroplasma endosymbiont of Tiphia femorata TaxID=3066326 RepID=UPI0030CBCE81
MFNLKKLKFWAKSSRANNEKISLNELIWIGFNYTCGIAFPMALIGIYYWNNGGVGLHMLWVILLCALIAAGTALAFTKCSRVYHDTNGGAYVYVRGVFGRFWGWIIGFIQYITLPSTIIVTIISMFRVNLDQLSIFNWVPERWSSLMIDSIGIFIYAAVASCMYFGMKGFRWFVNISGIIKWGSALFLIVCAIILVVTNKGLAFSQAAEGTKNINLTLPKINNAFSGFFYFFIGFETFIVVGKNVKNPTKNFGKGILIVLLLSTIFYLAVSVLVFGAITIDGTNGQNGWSGATNEYNPNNVISGIAGITGMIVLVISTLSLKLNGAMQNSLYSGGMIQPLAKEGYITEKLAKLNKENIAMRASTANLIITIIACIIMLIIPDLIGAPFDFNTVLGFSTNITIAVYIFVLASTCVMGYRKQIKIKIWEWIVFVACGLFLLSQFVVFNYGMINDMINKRGEVLIAVIIEFLMFWMFIVIAVIWYFIYYQPKLKMRLASNLDYQNQLDQEFIPMTEEEAIKYLLNEPETELERIKIHENEARSVTT